MGSAFANHICMVSFTALAYGFRWSFRLFAIDAVRFFF